VPELLGPQAPQVLQQPELPEPVESELQLEQQVLPLELQERLVELAELGFQQQVPQVPPQLAQVALEPVVFLQQEREFRLAAP
jgi:hypothetical protein